MPNQPEPSAEALQPATPAAPTSFEAALARLEAIVHELEEGRTGLADALARYEEGVALLRNCFGILETTERRIELLAGVDAAGNPLVEPFDDTASAERAEQGAPRGRSRSAPSAKAKSAANSRPTDPSSAERQAADPPPQDIPPAGNMDVPRGLF
jgi:exodeoxyribonuclease VII small subunit